MAKLIIMKFEMIQMSKIHWNATETELLWEWKKKLKKKLIWSSKGDFHDLSLTLISKALCLETIDPHKDNLPDCTCIILFHDIIP